MNTYEYIISYTDPENFSSGGGEGVRELIGFAGMGVRGIFWIILREFDNPHPRPPPHLF